MTTHKAISKIVYVHIYLPGEGKKKLCKLLLSRKAQPWLAHKGKKRKK